MACVTMKRPLEWVDPSMNADASGPSSPKAMMIDHASGSGRSPKRLRKASPADLATPGTSAASSSSLFKPFTSHALREQIAAEMRKNDFGHHHAAPNHTHTTTAAAVSAVAAATHSSVSSTSFAADSDSENRPLFSFNQVVMIVERLLREKEDDIRQEYDKVLVNRLAEQYEQFVKFTYDQIQRNFDTDSTPSYLS